VKGKKIRVFFCTPALRDKKRGCSVVEDPVFSGINPFDSLEMEVSGVPAAAGFFAGTWNPNPP